MKRSCSAAVLIAFAMVVGFSPVPARAEATDCGIDNVRVEFSEWSDAEIVCDGVLRALHFFEFHGFADFRHIYVEVRDRSASETLANDPGQPAEVTSRNHFDKNVEYSRIAAYGGSSARQGNEFCGLPVSREYHASIVAHEVAHDLYHQVLAAKGAEVERPMAEFVSYVVQIATMNEQEKAQVMQNCPGNAFRTTLGINSLSWAMNPHMFAVMSYRYNQDNPGFMAEVLDGKVASGDKLMIYP